MKKIVILLLVLGMVTTANAGLVVLMDTGSGMAALPAEITLEPSDIFELSLVLTNSWLSNGFGVDFILSNAQGELITDGATGTYPGISETMTDIGFPETGWDFDGVTPINLPQHVRATAGNLFSDYVSGPILMDELYVHCLETTDVVLTIVIGATTQAGVIGTENIPVGTSLGSVIIHQIPEPITIVLLGLGGLFIRRKK